MNMSYETKEGMADKCTIQLGQREADITLVLPNGQLIELQYRLLSPSIDICLPEPTSVTNWIGEDMEPAPAHDGKEHVRKAIQLIIDINPEFVD